MTIGAMPMLKLREDEFIDEVESACQQAQHRAGKAQHRGQPQWNLGEPREAQHRKIVRAVQVVLAQPPLCGPPEHRRFARSGSPARR